MLYIYRRRNSTTARDLRDQIMLGGEGFRGIPARRTKGLMLRELQNGDKVVCLGDHFAAPQGIKTLNNIAPVSKLVEAQKLAAAGVSTVQVSRTRPAVERAARPAFAPNLMRIDGGNLTYDQLTVLMNQINTHRQAEEIRRRAHERAPLPAQPAQEWLARRNNHIGGNDLLEGNINDADFYSKKENITEEYRLHMFKGKSIRAGRKVADPERVARPHAWIRSFDAGWTIRYDGFESTKAMRDLAAAALKALGLDFGAVDIGRKADGGFLVLEVNRVPGMEGGTTQTYAKHIINWVNNPEAA